MNKEIELEKEIKNLKNKLKKIETQKTDSFKKIRNDVAKRYAKELNVPIKYLKEKFTNTFEADLYWAFQASLEKEIVEYFESLYYEEKIGVDELEREIIHDLGEDVFNNMTIPSEDAIYDRLRKLSI